MQIFFNVDSEDKKRNTLVICNACRLKLDSFKLFWLQFRANGNLLRVLRQRPPHSSGAGGGGGGGEDKLLNDVIKQQLGCLKPLDFSLAKEEVESVEAELGSRSEERRRERNRQSRDLSLVQILTDTVL